MYFYNIIKSIRSYYPVSDESINQLIEHFTVHHFPAKHLIIRGGVIDRNVYFIEKGLTRSYCLVDGNEHTTWFSKEGDITFGLFVCIIIKPALNLLRQLNQLLRIQYQ